MSKTVDFLILAVFLCCALGIGTLLGYAAKVREVTTDSQFNEAVSDISHSEISQVNLKRTQIKIITKSSVTYCFEVQDGRLQKVEP